jgi:hypothetical protein
VEKQAKERTFQVRMKLSELDMACIGAELKIGP